MLLGEVRLKQQLGVGILLVHTVVFLTVIGIQQVHRNIAHQCYVRAVFWVETEGVLHVTLVTVGLYTYFIKVMGIGCRVMCLSTLPFLLHHTDSAMKQVGVAFPLPAVL